MQMAGGWWWWNSTACHLAVTPAVDICDGPQSVQLARTPQGESPHTQAFSAYLYRLGSSQVRQGPRENSRHWAFSTSLWDARLQTRSFLS